MNNAADRVMPGAGRNESLMKGLAVLECLSSATRGLLVADVVRETSLPRSTVSRLLASLLEAGAAARDDEGRWTVGPLVRRLAGTSADVEVYELGMVALRECTDATGETTMLAVPVEGSAARVLGEVEGAGVLSVRTTWAGEIVTSLASGFVRLVLAEAPDATIDEVIARRDRTAHTAATLTDRVQLREAIERVRREQRTTVVDELELGLCGVGVPVRLRGRLVAMLAVYLPTARFDDAHRGRVTGELEAAAQRLERRLAQRASTA